MRRHLATQRWPIARWWPIAVWALLEACATTGGIHARLGWSEERGLRVVEVPEGGAADRAGLRVDDRIVGIDGEPVRVLSMAEVVESLRGPVGSMVVLTVQRDDELLEMRVQRAAYR